MRTLLIALALLAAAGIAAAKEESMEFGGRTRWWLVHEPAKAGPLPLVLVLHGGGGFPANAEKMSDMSALADREGFLAVYPAGTGRLSSRRWLTWNAGNCCGYAQKNDVDDVGFLSALIERLIKEGRADPNRVYVTGLSNGAMMAHALACGRADLIAAIAPVAGAIGVDRCEPSRPVSVLMIHGRADKHVPYDGGRGDEQLSPRTDRSVKENFQTWLKADACRADARVSEKDGVRDEDYESCAQHSGVRLISHPGGHVWPGGHPGLRWGNADPVVPEPKASQVIWDFFRGHARQ